jgi:cell division transport system ATP-binding protein
MIVETKKTQRPVIEFQNITKIYGKGDHTITALDNVTFNINKDEFVTLVGPSGAGKSTLLRLLICEEKPTSGRILVGGYDIGKLTPNEIPYFRRKVGVVYQDFKLLPQKNVYENVAFAMEVSGLTDADIRRSVPKILKIVGLDHRINNLPHELSGGEKQRVSIARSLVHNPKLIMADEPTGNLDPNTSFEIIELLLRINQAGTIVLLATHNKEIVDALGRRVVTINNGRVVSDEKIGRYKV